MRPSFLILAVIVAGAISGCGRAPANGDYVARVGDSYLTQEAVTEQLARLPFGGDSVDARQQIIEQWVTNELLYRESRRRGIRNDRGVQRLLEESERSVMVNALVGRMYEDEHPELSEADLSAYYEQEKERLRLREPFVQVRYVTTSERSSADEVRAELQRAGTDSASVGVWEQVVGRHATDAAASRTLASTFTAESRLFQTMPAMKAELTRLGNGQVSSVHESDSLFHVVQLVQRAPAGSVPEMAWVEEDLTRRLLIQARKQLYARQVQRLRNEALAREELEIR